MKTSGARFDGSARQVRSRVHRVALAATLLALVLYLLASLVVDVVAVDRLNGAIDSRLAARLQLVAATLPVGGPTGTIGSYSPKFAADGDFDDAPIVLWWVPAQAAHAVPLQTNAPGLPQSALHVAQPTDATVGGRGFRLSGRSLGDGRLIAGTTAEQVSTALSTLVVIEAILGPLGLVILYGAAWVIGRSAAAPVERARRRQLEFTADASHELRTPLSVIEAEVGLALHAKRSAPAYREALERVSGETKRLRSIVEDLLWLARLDSLPAPPQPEVVDVASLATVCADRFRPVAARRGITVSVTTEGSPPPLVFIVAEWLDRLVSVLVDNACRYADDGGRVEVTVSTAADKVALVVDDSGPGVSDQDRQRIFQRFHRASAVPGGAGLGLAIAEAVLRDTGGTYMVERAPIGGARFSMSWPRHRGHDGWAVLHGASEQHDERRQVDSPVAPAAPLGEPAPGK
ncbi:MAG: sensor histidine kinase [Acidimicrobiales bacterium]